MKKTRIVLVGALVLALAFVMGCAGLGSGDEDVDGGNKEKTWKTTNESTAEYKRMFQTFGGSKNFTEAVITINAKYPKNGWSGVLFGLTENDDKASTGKDKNTINFYNVSFRVSESGQIMYYTSYFSNVDQDDFPNNKTESYGQETVITNTTTVPTDAGLTLNEDGSLNLAVKVMWFQKEGVDVGTWDLYYGPSVTQATKHKEALTSDTVVAKEIVKGGLAAYGQVTKAANKDNPRVVETVWKVESSKPTVIGAAEEE